MTTIDIDQIRLAAGAHERPEEGMCFNEAVAYFRGLPHSDAPMCVSPVPITGGLRQSALLLLDRLIDVGKVAVVPAAGTTEEEQP